MVHVDFVSIIKIFAR
uniref:Uncharacterized protein n=1 Tax=Arundo donax TaxID=35708 RepID=A0A0A9H4B0_ARUDO